MNVLSYFKLILDNWGFVFNKIFQNNVFQIKFFQAQLNETESLNTEGEIENRHSVI